MQVHSAHVAWAKGQCSVESFSELVNGYKGSKVCLSTCSTCRQRMNCNQLIQDDLLRPLRHIGVVLQPVPAFPQLPHAGNIESTVTTPSWNVNMLSEYVDCL